ncbi:MAG: hypothetical protein ABEH88_05355 [Halobacteriales archaeon]
MSEFRRAGRERINVFSVGDTYLFKHYVSEELFSEIDRYYEEYDYRFEVPADRFEFVRERLEDHDYAPVVIEDPEPFAVLKRKYTTHPDALFRDAVYQRGLGKFNCFVMKTREAAENAAEAGAIPLAEADLTL